MNRSFSKTLLSFALIGSLALTGCASTGSDMLDSSTAADPRLTRGSDAKFFSTSGLTACAAAAGVGILGCAVSNTSDKAQCMIAAGIVGCGVGLGANYYYDQRRSQYANTSERLALMSQDIQADTEKVATRTAVAQQVINDDRERLASIEKAIASKTLDRQAAQREVAQIDNNLAQMRKELDGMRNKVGEYQKTAQLERQNGGGNEVAQVEEQISKMNAKVASLQSEVDSLYSQRSAITLG